MSCWKILLLAFLICNVSCRMRIKAKHGTKVESFKADEKIWNVKEPPQVGRSCKSVKDCEGFSKTDLGEACNIVHCSSSNQCECVY